IGSGAAVTINALAELILRLSPQSVPVRHGPERPGDVRSSVADISAAATVLGYRPAVSLQDGLRSCFEWMSAREKETVSWRASWCSVQLECSVTSCVNSSRSASRSTQHFVTACHLCLKSSVVSG